MKRSHTRRLGGASAAVVLAGALTLAGAPGSAGAEAADDYLKFSLDGKSYAPTISGPVFSEAVTYIPGSGQTATVWVRNNSNEKARLSSAALLVRSDPDLNGYLGLTASEASKDADRVDLGAQGTCRDLPASWDHGSGQEIELAFVVDLSLDAPNATQNRDAEFDLVFYLESTAAGLEPRAACDVLDGGTGGDAGTGTGPGAGNGSPAGIGGAGIRVQGVSQQDSAPVPGSLVALTGSGSSPAEPQPVAEGAVAELPADRKSTGTVGQEPAPQALEAMVQSTVEPVIRSLSGTLLIAMSVAFSAAVVFRVWSRRYE